MKLNSLVRLGPVMILSVAGLLSACGGRMEASHSTVALATMPSQSATTVTADADLPTVTITARRLPPDASVEARAGADQAVLDESQLPTVTISARRIVRVGQVERASARHGSLM